jgi:S-adenosylmethionine hydrolase
MIITLLTDYGDFYAAQIKGVLAGNKNNISIIDITHDIRPHKNSVLIAAYILRHAADKFPKGTIHMAVVDPGVGGKRAALAIRTKNYWFVGPDNGLLAPAAESDGVKEIFTINLAAKSRTFHGKDIFAPAAIGILKGNRKFLQKTKDYVRLDLNNKAFVNRFGNIELPIKEEIISVNGMAVKNFSTYSDTQDGEIFSVIDSRGLREIAAREGNASRKLGSKITVRTKSKTYNFDVIRLGV